MMGGWSFTPFLRPRRAQKAKNKQLCSENTKQVPLLKLVWSEKKGSFLVLFGIEFQNWLS